MCCLHVRQGVSSGGWANKVPRPLRGDVGRRAYLDTKFVLLLHSNQVGVGVDDATGALAGSQRSYDTHTHTQIHAQRASSQTVINTQTKVGSAGSQNPAPGGKSSANSQAGGRGQAWRARRMGVVAHWNQEGRLFKPLNEELRL